MGVPKLLAATAAIALVSGCAGSVVTCARAKVSEEVAVFSAADVCSTRAIFRAPSAVRS